jgi:4-hydroxy-tetrahydrodipicolinate synthase
MTALRAGSRFEIVVALATPFRASGEPDDLALQGHLDLLLEHDLDGFLVGGTTGEGPLLDDDEVEHLTHLVAKAAGGRVPVITQVGRPSTRMTLRLAERVVAAGADQLAVVAPYYYQLSSGELEHHLRSVLRAVSPTPLLAYNIPSRAVNDLSPALIQTLADEGLAGLKDSTGSWERHLEYLRIRSNEAETGFRVYVGSEAITLQAMRAGSRGVISALSNAAPELQGKLRDAYTRRLEGAALEIDQTIGDLRTTLREAGLLGGLKRSIADRLEQRGIQYPTTLRPPLLDQ